MKNLLKIILVFILSIFVFWDFHLNAAVPWLEDIQWKEKITNHSNTINSTWNITEDVQSLWLGVLTQAKFIISAIIVIFIVYIWIQMVMSMWSDEERLSSAKRQLRYSLVWFIFINIPWTIFNMFDSETREIDWAINSTYTNDFTANNKNIFVNLWIFDETINGWIVMFIETAIFAIAVLMIVIAWIRLIMARWRDEEMTEAKNKIVWSVIWLIFIWFIEAWQNLMYNWKISDWANLFETLEKLALFFAWPVWIFFLTLAWYYFITAAWDEEKVKKAKNIIINTLIATVILLASHAFLKDLISLTI